MSDSHEISILKKQNNVLVKQRRIAENARDSMSDALEYQKKKNKFNMNNMFRMVRELLPESADVNLYIKTHLENINELKKEK